MNKRRLLKIADIVEKVPPKKFFMENWWIARDCGTVGCAIGHACQDKGIRRAGLRLDEYGEPIFGDEYDELYGFPAVALFCDIEFEDALYLFDAEEYSSTNPRPSTVTKRIRAFVERGGRA